MSEEVQVEEPTIPNWTFFSAHHVVIDLFKHSHSSEPFYNVVMTILLDDGTEDQRGISLITDLNTDDVYDAMDMAVDSIITLFDSVSATIDVYDADSGDVVESFDMNKLAHHDMEVETAKDNRVLH